MVKKINTKHLLLLYSLLTGILLATAWYVWGTGLVLLFALVPLLFVEDHLCENKTENRSHKAFLYAAAAFLTWNLMTTWWILNASFVGMVLAVTINTLLMSSIFWLFHITKRNTGTGPGYFGLITYWLVYEHFYLNGEISWPWLNLGNGFANDIHIIQWYEYTGAFGGTLWVLLSNILLFIILKKFIQYRTLRKQLLEVTTWLLLIIIPLILSLIIFHNYKEQEDPREIIVLQPNIDPYNEKFGGLEFDFQLDKLLSLADPLVTDKTDYIVAPETFINNNVWLHTIGENSAILRINEYILEHPRVKFVVGLTYYQLYINPEDRTGTARPLPGTELWYDSYNAGIQLDTTGIIQIYNKSQLVVGVEKMPYPEYLGFLRNLTLRLGGTFRSHGTQEYRENFFDPADSTGVAPVICYESVFGEYVTDYIKAGANYIFVITNDGWWGNTPGHRQHFAFSRLRAIETRRSVARSANTGISAFINQKGEILARTVYWVPDALRGRLNANDKLTFYTRHGDFIARWAYFFALITLAYTIVMIILLKKR